MSMRILVLGVDGQRQALDRSQVEVGELRLADLKFFDMLLLLISASSVYSIGLISQVSDGRAEQKCGARMLSEKQQGSCGGTRAREIAGRGPEKCSLP